MQKITLVRKKVKKKTKPSDNNSELEFYCKKKRHNSRAKTTVGRPKKIQNKYIHIDTFEYAIRKSLVRELTNIEQNHSTTTITMQTVAYKD